MKPDHWTKPGDHCADLPSHQPAAVPLPAPPAASIAGLMPGKGPSMSEESQSSTSANPPSSSLDEPSEERVLSRAERRARRRDSTPWLGGAILIVLGLIFLAQNFGVATLNNWWAIFILIPAVGAFSAAWRKYQAAGDRLTSDALGSLIGGLVLTAVSLVFLFNLKLGPNDNLLWPLLLIVGGVAVLLQALAR
jgi:hypothetical protein